MTVISTPMVRELVLVGGGHSHALALRSLGMRPIPGVRVTLVSDVSHAPYSGMLPGHFAGVYTWEESHIDLRRLCQFAGARFVGASVVGLDPRQKRVRLANRPALAFDTVSLNVGSTPQAIAVPGAAEFATPAKPVPRLLEKWEAVRTAVEAGKTRRLVVVGGGAGGVELALAMKSRLRDHVSLTLVHQGDTILPTHNAKSRSLLMEALNERQIPVLTGQAVTAVRGGTVVLADGRELPADDTFWVTHAAAPSWFGESGLRVDDAGFLLVRDTLQSPGHDFVFAAGDCATVQEAARPKSGVFAVRAARPLVENFRRFFDRQPLVRWRPQRQFLSLLGTGDGRAVASRGRWAAAGAWVWRWKDAIDRKFMRQFEELPVMDAQARPAPASAQPSDLSDLSDRSDPSDLSDPAPSSRTARPARAPAPNKQVAWKATLQAVEIARGRPLAAELAELTPRGRMRCSGCAAKVGSGTLGKVLERLREEFHDIIDGRDGRADIQAGLAAPDDAAVYSVPVGRSLVQTVDYLPALVSDPFVFGRIAALHGFSDVFAMGAEPHSALAAALVPFGTHAGTEEMLFQLLSGVAVELGSMGALLLGGHSAEGSVPGLALTCNGLADPAHLMRKGGLAPNQTLLLTKPLGIGTLFAAEMRLAAQGRWIEAAVDSMLESNLPASRVLRDHDAAGCTDVTGFGLLGHLLEMLRASGVGARLDLDAIPLLEGAVDCAQRGLVSSLAGENREALAAAVNATDFARHPHLPLLFDPQTSGGLLAAVPEDRADACRAALVKAGCRAAVAIGSTTEAPDAGTLIVLLGKRT